MTWQPPATALPDRMRARAVNMFFVRLLTCAAPLLLLKDGILTGAYGAVVVGYAVSWLDARRARVLLGPSRLTGTSGQIVPYDQITSLRFLGFAVVSEVAASDTACLLVGHARGAFAIPRVRGLDRVALYRWLLERSSLATLPGPLPEPLERVRAAEVANFGCERVLATCGRAVDAGDRRSPARVVAILAGTGLAMLAAYVHGGSPSQLLGVAVFGFIGMVGWALFTALAVTYEQGLGRPERDVGLVLSPRGLTLESPGTKGTVAWTEVSRVRERDRETLSNRGLTLHVADAWVQVPDVFRLPLTEIAARIERYRHGS